MRPFAGIRALVVGAISRDRERGADGEETVRPGGVVLHAGMALARLGARTRVVTRVRTPDAATLLAPLDMAGVETLALPSRDTTTYRNDYSGAIDRHELLATSDPIHPEDVPGDWRAADLVQLGPLHPGDVLPETAAVLGGLKGLDAQGLVRVPGPGATQLRPFPALAALLVHVHVLQASEQEVAVVLDGESPRRFVARHGVAELIVTRGARGATVVTPAGAVDVPARRVRGDAKVGAGDVHLATYLFLRVRGRGPVDAAEGAARMAALKIARGDVP